MDRTLMSAQSVMTGLYSPPQGDQNWNEGINWYPVPIHTEPKTQDYVSASPSLSSPSSSLPPSSLAAFPLPTSPPFTLKQVDTTNWNWPWPRALTCSVRIDPVCSYCDKEWINYFEKKNRSTMIQWANLTFDIWFRICEKGTSVLGK